MADPLSDAIGNWLGNTFSGFRSPELNVNEAMDSFNKAYTKMQQGVPMDQLGIDTKYLDKTLGPGYSSFLKGYEKSDEHQNAVQKQQFANQLYQGFHQIVTDPTVQAAASYLMQPNQGGAGGGAFTPAQPMAAPFSGGGMVGGQPVTAQEPNTAEMARRFTNLSGEGQSVLTSPQIAEAGTQRRTALAAQQTAATMAAMAAARRAGPDDKCSMLGSSAVIRPTAFAAESNSR